MQFDSDSAAEDKEVYRWWSPDHPPSKIHLQAPKRDADRSMATYTQPGLVWWR